MPAVPIPRRSSRAPTSFNRPWVAPLVILKAEPYETRQTPRGRIALLARSAAAGAVAGTNVHRELHGQYDQQSMDVRERSLLDLGEPVDEREPDLSCAELRGTRLLQHLAP